MQWNKNIRFIQVFVLAGVFGWYSFHLVREIFRLRGDIVRLHKLVLYQWRKISKWYKISRVLALGKSSLWFQKNISVVRKIHLYRDPFSYALSAAFWNMRFALDLKDFAKRLCNGGNCAWFKCRKMSLNHALGKKSIIESKTRI